MQTELEDGYLLNSTACCDLELDDTIRYIYVRSKADDMASLV